MDGTQLSATEIFMKDFIGWSVDRLERKISAIEGSAVEFTLLVVVLFAVILSVFRA